MVKNTKHNISEVLLFLMSIINMGIFLFFFFSGKEIENYLLLNILTGSIVFMVWYRAERAIHILKDNGLARYDE